MNNTQSTQRNVNTLKIIRMNLLLDQDDLQTDFNLIRTNPKHYLSIFILNNSYYFIFVNDALKTAFKCNFKRKLKFLNYFRGQ